MNKFELTNTSQLETLFQSVERKTQKQACHFTQTYYIDSQKFTGLDYYHLNFEPYNSIAKQAGADQFGVWRGANDIYMGHINNAGHAARFMIRPITMEMLKDSDLILSLEENYCRELERNAVFGIPYEL